MKAKKMNTKQMIRPEKDNTASANRKLPEEYSNTISARNRHAAQVYFVSTSVDILLRNCQSSPKSAEHVVHDRWQ